MSERTNYAQATEELRATIEDTLGDTMLQDPVLVFCHTQSRTMIVGWYITYTIPGDFLQRAVYLGNDIKSIKRKFNLWVKNWMVK